MRGNDREADLFGLVEVFMAPVAGQIGSNISPSQGRIQQRIDAGVEHMHTMTADLAQLDLFAKHVLQPFKKTLPVRSRA